MRKVNATVLYTEHTAPNAATYYVINNFTVRRRDGIIFQIYSDAMDKIDRQHPHKYTSVWEMHENILQWLKSDYFKADYRESFGAKFYDILWIDAIKHTVHTFAH